MDDLVVIHLNLRGMKNLEKNWELLKSGHILMLQETWLEERKFSETITKLNNLYGKFLWSGKEARKKISRNGRASGGFLMAIKRDLIDHNVIYELKKWEYGLTLNIEKTNSPIYYSIINVYNNSRTNLENCLTEVDKEIKNIEKTKRRIIITGDFNAKIGKLQELDSNHKVKVRQSEDQNEPRSEGKTLIKWLKERKMVIMNGRTKEDSKGEVTHLSGGKTKGSILDLVIIKLNDQEELESWFKDLRILVQEGSDHFPVQFRLEAGIIEIPTQSSKIIKDNRKEKCKGTTSKKRKKINKLRVNNFKLLNEYKEMKSSTNQKKYQESSRTLANERNPKVDKWIVKAYYVKKERIPNPVITKEKVIRYHQIRYFARKEKKPQTFLSKLKKQLN